jgi:hypothetical protein
VRDEGNLFVRDLKIDYKIERWKGYVSTVLNGGGSLAIYSGNATCKCQVLKAVAQESLFFCDAAMCLLLSISTRFEKPWRLNNALFQPTLTTVLRLLDPVDETTMALRNFGNLTPNFTASLLKKNESSKNRTLEKDSDKTCLPNCCLKVLPLK